MQSNDISPADLGDGFKLNFQEVRGGLAVRAVVKDASGIIVVAGEQALRSEAIKSRFDAINKFLTSKITSAPGVDELYPDDEEDEENEFL